MGFDANVEFLRMAFWQILIISGPLLAVALAIGLASLSLLFINFKTMRFADFGPSPGSFEIRLTKSSISLIFCIFLKWPFFN